MTLTVFQEVQEVEEDHGLDALLRIHHLKEIG